MKNIIVRSVILIAALALSVGAYAAKSDKVFNDTQSHQVQLTKLKDKWIVVNYWASWCPTCMQEVPELNRFHEHNQNRNIIMLGVNYDHLPTDSLRQAVREANVSFPVLTEDPAEAWKLHGVVVLPTTFIINPEGKVVKKIIGTNTERSLLDTIHELEHKHSA